MPECRDEVDDVDDAMANISPQEEIMGLLDYRPEFREGLLNEPDKFFKKTDASSWLLVHLVVEKEAEVPGICSTYLEALKRVKLKKVLDNLKDADQKLYFVEAHLQPAACESDFELVRELLDVLHDQFPADTFYDVVHRKRGPLVASTDEDAARVDKVNAVNGSRHYNRSLLEMGADAGHRPALYEIVYGEFRAHRMKDDLDAGLECFASLPRSSFLRREAAQAYNRLAGKEPDILGTLFASFLEVFSVYFLILFDLAFDVLLIINYSYYAKLHYPNESATAVNETFRTPEKPDTALGVTKNLTCFGPPAKNRTDADYKFMIAFETSLSVISVSALIVWVVLCLSIHQKKSKTQCLCFLLRPMYAVFLFFVYSFKSKMSPDNPKDRKNYKTFLKAWKRVQKVKIGLETTSQMLIGLWILTLFYDDIEEHRFRDVYKIVKLGLAQMLISTTWCSDFLYVMLTKHLISSLFLCINVTVLRTQKKPQRLADSPLAFLVYFCSTALLLLMRSITFFVLFAQNFWLKIFVTLFHFIFSLFIRIFLELRVLAWKNNLFKGKNLSETLQLGGLTIADLLVSTIASSLTFISMDMSKLPDKDGELKRTFQPYFAHYLLVFLELVFVTFFTKERFSSQKFFTFPFFSGLVSAILLLIYYKFVHKSGAFKGIRSNYDSPCKKRIGADNDPQEMQQLKS